MRKSLLLTAVILMISFMGFAQEWHGITSDSPVKMKTKVMSSTENEIVVDVQIGGFYTTNVRTPEGKQAIVSVDKMVAMLEAGAPDLPMAPIPAIIGDRAEMTVNVINSTYVDIENVEVAPSKGNFSRQINPNDVPYTYGEMYQQNAFWPATQAYLEAPYILRDFRGQNIMVRPFAYNPVTKTLRVYTQMTIAMTKVSDNGENQKVSRRSSTIKVDPERKAEYERRFVNFSEMTAKYPFDEDYGELVIICPDQYMSEMEEFVAWKEQSGRPTTLVSLSEAGGNNDNNIKNYIASIYNDPDRNLEFILLIGEYNELTPHSMTGGRSDNWFGQLEGSDYYLEALTGRFSVQNAAQLQTHINKVINYERDLQADITWGDKGLGIGYIGAGNGHYGEDDYQHIDLIRDTLLHYTYESVSDLHGGGGGASQSSISGAVNNGVSIINYCNHGSPTSWGVANYSTSDVNQLVNDYKLPVVWSVACQNGQFDVNECFAEAWLRATNNSTGVPTGAVGGMFSWISQPWVPPMYGQDEMVDILTEWHSPDLYNHTMGGVSLNGSMYILDAAPSDNGSTFNTWLLFGDPSLMVRTANPTDMNVSLSPSNLMIGMSQLQVETENTSCGIATLTNAEGVIASARIINNIATLSFPSLSAVETLTLTVIGYNKVTHIEQLEVLPAEGAYISVDAFTPGTVPCNEQQTMSMTFKNVGVDPTAGTTNVVLSSTNDNISFIDNEGSFGVLGANETVTLNDEFSFTVAPGVADGTQIQIDVTATCGTNVWTGKAKITVGAPVMSFYSYQSNAGFVPGETETVVAEFVNDGHYMATNSIVTISSTSAYVSFEDDTYELGTIAPEGIGTSVFNVIIDQACPTTEVIELTFTFAADNDVTATGNGLLRNSCNVVFNLSDSYGDGWNGAHLNVAFSDGTPSQSLAVNSGNTASYTILIASGTVVTLTWSTGSYDSECSFTVSYEDGDQITSVSAPSSSYNFQFTVNCSGDPVAAAPVRNLEGLVEGNAVTLTWDAPETGTPVSYIIKRNGIDIDEVTVLRFVDEDLEWEMTYTYVVIANYGAVQSLPATVTVETGEDSVGENSLSLGIYPNPAKDVINVRTNAQSFEYQLINSIGQVVLSGNGEGNAELNVNEFSGVYFLRVIANGNSEIQKVIIK